MKILGMILAQLIRRWQSSRRGPKAIENAEGWTTPSVVANEKRERLVDNLRNGRRSRILPIPYPA